MKNQLEDYLAPYPNLISIPAANEGILRLVSRIREIKAFASGKLLLAGNGASASIASHLATDFSKQAGVRALAFNDANLITALGNDCGYENWISKALDLYADPGDLAVLISSSGKSPNVVRAAMKAKEMGIGVAAFTGFDSGNPLGQLADIHLWVDSRSYNIVECVHMIWLTAACDMVIGKSEYSVAG